MHMDGAPADSDRMVVVEHACEATALWLLGDSEGALQTLQKLEVQVTLDQQTSHNLQVAGFCSNPSEETLKQLTAFLQSCRAAAPSTKPQQPTKQQKAAKQQQPQQQSEAAPAYAPAACNQALLLSLQQQYASALQLIEPFHACLESLRPGTALHITCLLLECYLASQQFSKAAQLICFLEAAAVNQGRSAFREATPEQRSSSSSPTKLKSPASISTPTPTPSPAAATSSTAAAAAAAGGGGGSSSSSVKQPPSSPAPAGAASPAAAAGGGPAQQQQGCLLAPRLVLYGGPHVQQVTQLLAANHAPLLAPSPQQLAQYYKARLGLACGSPRLAKREVRALQSLLPGSHAGALLRAQLDLLRQRPRKALKALQPLLGDPLVLHRHRVQVLNQLGVLHHQLGKHQLAAIYLQNALAAAQAMAPGLPCSSSGKGGSSSSSSGSSGPPSSSAGSQQGALVTQQQRPGNSSSKQGASSGAHRQQAGSSTATASSSSSSGTFQLDAWSGALAADHTYDLLYNNGLQQLLLGHWEQALQCFSAAASKHYMQPQLWVRLAEACIGMYHHQQQQQLLVEQQQAEAALRQHAAQVQQQQQQQAAASQPQGKGHKRGQQQQQGGAKGNQKAPTAKEAAAAAGGREGSPDAPAGRLIPGTQQQELLHHEQLLRELLEAESLDPFRALPAVMAAARVVQAGPWPAGLLTAAGAGAGAGSQVPAGPAVSAGGGRSSSSSSSGGGGSSIAAATAPPSSSCMQWADEALVHLNVAYALLQDLQAESAKEAEAAAALAAEAAAAMHCGLGMLPPGAAAGGASLDLQAGDSSSSGPQNRNSSSGGSSQSITSATVQYPTGGSGSSTAAASAAAAAARVASELAGAAEWLPVQHAILSNLAYVHLLRQDPLPALHAARSLLACSELNPEQYFLGNSYAAEALCMLGRPVEAHEQLQSHMGLFAEGGDTSSIGNTILGSTAASSAKSDDGSAATGEGLSGCVAAAAGAAGMAWTGSTARAALLVNMGTVHAVQGDLDAAEAAAKRALVCEPGSLHALLLLVYLRLRQACLSIDQEPEQPV